MGLSRALSLVLAASPTALMASGQQVPGPPPSPTPMVSLKASYPHGEPLGSVVIPGNTRAVVAQGAVLDIVDLTTIDPGTGEPKLLQSVKVPDVSTQAMRYRLGANGERTVYIAGGSTGLWRINLCDSLFTSSTPPACAAQAELIDRVGCESNFSWKRCIDLDYVEGNSGAGDPLLLALFSASSDVLKRESIAACPADLGGTELRTYRILGNGTVVPYSSFLLSPVGIGPTAPNEELGLALATDPGDPNTVYVSLGWGGIRKVDITTAVFAATTVPLNLTPTCGLPDFALGVGGCPGGEQVRDLAVVRTPTLGPLLYAAMEHGRLAEVRLSTGAVSQLNVGVYFPTRVAAITDGADEVLVAVGFSQVPGVTEDSVAPFDTTGVWANMCIQVGILDVNHTPDLTFTLPDLPLTKVNDLRLFSRNAGNGLAPLAGAVPLVVDAGWNSLEFLPTPAIGRVRLYASTAYGGLHGFKAVLGSQPLAWTISDAWPGGKAFNGLSFGIGHPTISVVDNAIGGGGFDGFGAPGEGRMFAISTNAGVTGVQPIPNTLSVCANRSTPYPKEMPCPAPYADLQHSEPGPFILQSGSSSPNWLDPFDASGSTEWFVSGDSTSWYADPATCSWGSDDIRCVMDPCLANPQPVKSPWGKRKIPGAGTDVGWLLARMKTGAATPGTIDGLQMELDWWQLPSNNVNGDMDRSRTAPYTTSTADPRIIPVGPSAVPVPAFIHLIRNGAKEGLKIVRTRWLMDRANGVTAACPANLRGNGEPLGSPVPPAAWGAGSNLEMLSVLTHVDIATAGCKLLINEVDCADELGTAPLLASRFAFNNKAHIFSVPDPNHPGIQHWILGVASGFVATAPHAENAGCPWVPHYRRALTVFLDITDLIEDPSSFLSQPLPQILAVGLGPVPSMEPPMHDEARASHAFALRTREYASPSGPRTFAYVADLLGRVMVYDVSWDKLEPLANPPNPMPGFPTKRLLDLHRTHRFPADPFDGRRPNCTDLVIDQEMLYCATVRGGVHLLEIGSIPAPSPTLDLPTFAFLDTPGMATGLTVRLTEPLNRLKDQLLVADNRCGLRIYSRFGN